MFGKWFDYSRRNLLFRPCNPKYGRKGVMQGPRVVGTGLGFCRTCGHGDSHKLPIWYNEQSHPWAERVDGPWELRKAVRKRLRENPDAIKYGLPAAAFGAGIKIRPALYL